MGQQTMVEEFSLVSLTIALPQYRLRAGDMGTVVDVIKQGEAYIIEFATILGKTVAVVEVSPASTRLIEPDEIARLRVEYGREVLERLRQEVNASAKAQKFVFAGHRGCCKSTLLKRFAVEMQSQHFTVFFSIADLIEPADMTPPDAAFRIRGVNAYREGAKTSSETDSKIETKVAE